MLFLKDLKETLEDKGIPHKNFGYTIVGCSVKTIREEDECLLNVTFEDKDDNISLDFDLDKKVFRSYDGINYNSVLATIKKGKLINSLFEVDFRVRRGKPYILAATLI